jgi:type 1 fimbria pilin
VYWGLGFVHGERRPTLQTVAAPSAQLAFVGRIHFSGQANLRRLCHAASVTDGSTLELPASAARFTGSGNDGRANCFIQRSRDCPGGTGEVGASLICAQRHAA